MKGTRRFWGVVGTAGVLAIGGAILSSLTLILGSGLLVAWLLALQIAFVNRLKTVDRGIDYVIDHETDRPTIDDPTTVRLETTLTESTVLDLAVTLPLPPAAAGDPITLSPAEGTTSDTAILEWSAAGSFRIGPPRLTARDPFGLFVESIDRGPTVDVAPTPRRPETVHLGQGGERVAAAYGQHTTEGTGPGIEPAELREYQPGDDLRRIDWKATARLAEPHVMESTAETDRRTVLLVDRRERMGVGPPGATQFDYARAAALAIADSARELGDPLGLFLVGDEGITTEQAPRTAPGIYDRIETALRNATPTTVTEKRLVEPERGPADATHIATQLRGSDDRFATQLVPLLETATPYVQRIEDRPLFSTARTQIGALQGTVWTVIVTDDSGRGELKETVDLARRGNGRVLAILTPRCLFEADGLTDVEAAYEAYADFESFRRDLAAMDRVEAFELAPGDRLAAVLQRGGVQA